MNDDRTILLVEDNEDDVLLVQRALRKGGIQASIHVAGDGDQALAYFMGAAPYQPVALYPLPAIVLLDLKLPKRSGLEVLQWIKTHQQFATLPVVVFTNSVQEKDVRQAYAFGANSYLKKPYSSAETAALLKAVTSYWLDHNQRARIPARLT